MIKLPSNCFEVIFSLKKTFPVIKERIMGNDSLIGFTIDNGKYFKQMMFRNKTNVKRVYPMITYLFIYCLKKEE